MFTSQNILSKNINHKIKSYKIDQIMREPNQNDKVRVGWKDQEQRIQELLCAEKINIKIRPKCKNDLK